MFRAAQSFFAKALIVALLATSVSNAESIHESVAVDMLNEDPAPVLIKRYLRSTAAVTMSSHGNELEERAVPFGVTIDLDRIVSKAEMRWWELLNKTPENLFEDLKFGVDAKKLFMSRKFFNWVAFYMKSNPIPEKKAIKGILEILRNYYGKNVVDRTLLTAPDIGNPESFAAKCLDAVIESWKKDGKTEDEAFKWLMPGVTADQLFESPLFLKWANYAGDETKMLEVLKRFDEEDLAKAIFAEKKSKDVRTIAVKLQNARWNNMGGDMKTPEDFFAVLEYHGARTHPDLVAALMGQVKQTNIKNAEFIALFDKHISDDAHVALMLASVETGDYDEWKESHCTPGSVTTDLNSTDFFSKNLIDKVATAYKTFYKNGRSRV